MIVSNFLKFQACASFILLQTRWDITISHVLTIFGVKADYSSRKTGDIETSTFYNSRMHKFTVECCEL